MYLLISTISPLVFSAMPAVTVCKKKNSQISYSRSSQKRPHGKTIEGGRLLELKNKGKVPVSNSKNGHNHLPELFTTKLKSQFKRGFTKVVVTWAGRLREWSKGELRMYFNNTNGLLQSKTSSSFKRKPIKCMYKYYWKTNPNNSWKIN